MSSPWKNNVRCLLQHEAFGHGEGRQWGDQASHLLLTDMALNWEAQEAWESWRCLRILWGKKQGIKENLERAVIAAVSCDWTHFIYHQVTDTCHAEAKSRPKRLQRAAHGGTLSARESWCWTGQHWQCSNSASGLALNPGPQTLKAVLKESTYKF